jgi:ATP-dependent Clp protease protease subunit
MKKYRNENEEAVIEDELAGSAPEIITNGTDAIVYLDEEICAESINPLVQFIIQENIARELETITIFIDSPGGDLSAAWKLIDIISVSKIKIRTIGIGSVMSAALLILMSGHERILSENTEVMSHQPTFNASGLSAQLKDFDSLSKMFGKTFTRVLDYYGKHTGLTGEALRDTLLGNSDEWLTAQEAINHGFADKILQDFGLEFWDLFPLNDD